MILDQKGRTGEQFPASVLFEKLLIELNLDWPSIFLVLVITSISFEIGTTQPKKLTQLRNLKFSVLKLKGFGYHLSEMLIWNCWQSACILVSECSLQNRYLKSMIAKSLKFERKKFEMAELFRFQT